MKEYKERRYRELFAKDNRQSFVVEYMKSDLWIAVDSASYDKSMPDFCLTELSALWNSMEHYLYADNPYAATLEPYEASAGTPEIFHRMSKAAAIAGIGPMGAVAGGVADHIARKLKDKYDCREIIIENGGDIYAEFVTPLDVSVFAGDSPLSEKVGFSFPPTHSPLGICTSSGTVGHSFSFGKADAAMIVCRDVLLADSYATAFANKVQTVDDISPVIEEIRKIPEILAALIIKDDRMGVAGIFDLKIFA